jgi:hypothetical protein
MNPKQQMLANALTYAGTVPFVLAGSKFLQVFFPFIDTTHIVMTYSAIIVSFLCGIHWACYLFFAQCCPRNLLLTSNIVALLAWLSVLAHNPLWSIFLQILCFLYLLLLDFKLREADILPVWFYRLRRNATMIVVTSLIITVGYV